MDAGILRGHRESGAPRTNTVFPKFYFQRNTVLQYCVTKIMYAEEHSTKVRGTSIIRCGDTLPRPEP